MRVFVDIQTSRTWFHCLKTWTSSLDRRMPLRILCCRGIVLFKGRNGSSVWIRIIYLSKAFSSNALCMIFCLSLNLPELSAISWGWRKSRTGLTLKYCINKLFFPFLHGVFVFFRWRSNGRWRVIVELNCSISVCCFYWSAVETKVHVY